jgi:hypothetical protein
VRAVDISTALGRVALLLLLLLALTLTGCSGGESPSDVPTDAPSGERAEPVDPYDVYVKNNPPGEKVISREDAQARAYLGCDMKFAPGTVDYVLQEAYADLCD